MGSRGAVLGCQEKGRGGAKIVIMRNVRVQTVDVKQSLRRCCENREPRRNEALTAAHMPHHPVTKHDA